jgi:hypothetical protein
VICGQKIQVQKNFVSYFGGTSPSCLNGHKEKMKGVRLPSPTSSTFFKENGGLEKQQKFAFDTFATRKLGAITQFEKMPIGEESHGDDDFCAYFSQLHL